MSEAGPQTTSSSHRRVALVAAMALPLLLLLVAAPPSSAKRAYVADSGGTLAILDTAANVTLGAIPLGGEPVDVAVTPDGSRAYVVDAAGALVLAIDTAIAAAIAAPIPVGAQPRAIAISPDGRFAYVANSGADTVSVIDLGANSVSGAPIAVGPQPEGVAVTPDARRLLVAQRGGDVAVVDLASRSVIAAVPDPLGPAKLALTPDGFRGLVANADSSSVSVFSTISATVFGVPVLVGANPGGVAVSSNGFAYAASTSNNTVTAIDTATHSKVGSPIPGFAQPKGLAASADGTRVYVANSAAGSVSVLNTEVAQVVGQVQAGTSPQAVAISPDQAPRASFAAQLLGKQGTSVSFDGSASVDPDGRIAEYAWDFGDGQGEAGPHPVVTHAYAEPGKYRVSLVVTDAAGCSTTFLFTGQTVTCNGSPAAATQSMVDVPDRVKPKFRLVGANRQRLGRWVTVVAHCPDETCIVTANGVLRTRVVRPARRGAGTKRGAKPRARVHRGRHGVRRARSRIRDGGQMTLRLRLPGRSLAKARAALRQNGRATVTVRAVARDLARNRSVRRLHVQLVKPKSRGARRVVGRSSGL